jgi:hypothetical protein
MSMVSVGVEKKINEINFIDKDAKSARVYKFKNNIHQKCRHREIFIDEILTSVYIDDIIYLCSLLVDSDLCVDETNPSFGCKYIKNGYYYYSYDTQSYQLYHRGAKINDSNYIEWSLLHLASAIGRPSIVKLLVDIGYDSRKRDIVNRTPNDIEKFIMNCK